MKVKKMLAIGDIHVFKNKRFHEHEYLFEKFINIAKEEKPDLIVIPGDVIDSKVNISPEQVILVRNFLSAIAEISEIVMILGNHDLNLSNKERKDLITTIIESLKGHTKNKINFYPHSGIYNLQGINWAVWSCLDDQISPFQTSFVLVNDYTVGLYHGAVKGCIADNGMELSDGMDIKEFSDCDIVIMSDIHTRSSFRNNEINYTGGFLQVKESEVPHGTYLVYDWDENLNKHYPTAKTLDNKFSTLVYKVENLDNLVEFEKVYDEQIIKLVYDKKYIAKSDILDYKKKLQLKYPNKFETKPLIIPKKKSPTEELSEDKEILSMSFEELLKVYMERQLHNLKNVKDIITDYEEVIRINKIYDDGLTTDNHFEAGDYYFESLIINNLFSFGPVDTLIDIFSLDGINGINGANYSGKSTIIKALMFVIFETIPSSIQSNKKIINKHHRDKLAYGEIVLYKQGRRFRIKRTITPKKTDNVSFELDFEELMFDGSVVSLKGEKKQDTQKEINKFFSSESNFELLSAFSAQKKQIEFIDCTNSKRLEHVNNFMGLQSYATKFKDCHDDIKIKNKVFEELLKEFDSNINVDDLEAEIEELEEGLEEEEKGINLLKDDLAYAESQLSELNSNYYVLKINAEKEFEDVTELKSLINSHQLNINKIDSSRENKYKEIQLIEDAKTRKDEDIKAINIKKHDKLLLIPGVEYAKSVTATHISGCEKSIEKELYIIEGFESLSVQVESTFNHLAKDIQTSVSIKSNSFYIAEIKEVNDKIAVLKSDINRYMKQLNIDVCNNCSKEFTNADKVNTSKKIDQCNHEISLCGKELDAIQNKENALVKIKLKFDEIHEEINNHKKSILKIQNQIEKLKNDIASYDNEIAVINTESSLLDNEISNKLVEKALLDNDIAKIENKYLNIDNDIAKIELLIVELEKRILISNKIEEEIIIAKNKIEELKIQKQPIENNKNNCLDLINQSTERKGKIIQEIKQAKKELTDYKSKFEKISFKEEELRLLNLYKEIIAKDGLPLFILKEKVGSINSEINTIINQVFDFDLLFIVDEDNGELNIEFNYEDDVAKSDVSLASGSETFIINLCIRVGLSQVTENPRCLSLIVDEGFGTLDKTNVDKIPLLFTTLLNYYKNIILISHLDELKDIYNNEIKIKREKYSMIEA